MALRHCSVTSFRDILGKFAKFFGGIFPVFWTLSYFCTKTFNINYIKKPIWRVTICNLSKASNHK